LRITDEGGGLSMELSLRRRRWNGFPSSRLAPAAPGSSDLAARGARAEPSPAALAKLGLGVVVRPFVDCSNEEVRRVYCLSCGIEIDASRRHADLQWARCPQGCNAANPRLGGPD
jgi:hypothetical protein